MGNKIVNKKGFTLIELLAVIVILAILILLAMPSVLKLTENARKSAFETEAESIITAAKTKYSQDMLNGTNPQSCYSLDDLSDVVDKNFTESGYSGSVQINVTDSKATYKIWLSNGKYLIDGEDSGKIKGNATTATTAASDNCTP